MPYTIYKAADGQYHARDAAGQDMCNGMHQPIRRVYASDLADYLHWLNCSFRFEKE